MALAELRGAGDVKGLLALVDAARGTRDPALARLGALALGSLGAVPGEEAQTALREAVRDERRPALERTTALAALWRREDREFVEALGRESVDPVVRSKVRALTRAARSHGAAEGSDRSQR